MTPLHHLKRSFATLLALGLILLVSLFVVRSLAGLGTQPAASPPENAGQAETVAGATNTAQGQEGAKPATPTAIQAIDIGKQISTCASPLSDSLVNEKGISNLQDYRFSAPQVVLTNDYGFRIMGWTSNDEVLLLRDLTAGLTKAAIEIYNVKSGQSLRFADENTISGNLLWLPNKKAVAYIVHDLYTDSTKNRSRLMVATFESGTPQLLAEGVTQPLFSMPDESVVVLEPNEQNLIRVSARDTSTPSKILGLTMRGVRLLHVAQHPYSPMVTLYNETSFVILNIETGKADEFRLGKWQEENLWAQEVRWSPDGKLLAVIATISGLPGRYTTLMILDIEKECLWEIPVSRPFYIDEMAWSPVGRYLLLSGFIGTTTEGFSIIEYRLLDPITGQERQVKLSDYYGSDNYFDWSPDGKNIIFYCPTPEKGALCTVTVEVEQ